MDASSQIREASRALSGLEGGSMSVADVYAILDKQDPVLVYFLVRYLRETYTPTNPQAQGVTTRLLELTSTYSDLVKRMKQAEKDSIVEWFDDTYSMRDFHHKGDELISMIVDKLES